MANQRMYLICTQCLEKPETTLEECIEWLGKYYPMGGWEMPEQEDVQRFFKKHDHRGTLDGKYVRIIYDSEFSEFAKSRDEIVGQVAAAVGKPS